MSTTTTATPSPWAEAHRREANARTYEIAAELHRQGSGGDANRLANTAVSDPYEYRSALARSGLADVRVDREVRRVDGLATGRLVRESDWRHEVISRSGLRTTASPDTALPFYDLDDARRWCRVGERAARITIRRVRRST